MTFQFTLYNLTLADIEMSLNFMTFKGHIILNVGKYR